MLRVEDLELFLWQHIFWAVRNFISSIIQRDVDNLRFL